MIGPQHFTSFLLLARSWREGSTLSLGSEGEAACHSWSVWSLCYSPDIWGSRQCFDNLRHIARYEWTGLDPLSTHWSSPDIHRGEHLCWHWRTLKSRTDYKLNGQKRGETVPWNVSWFFRYLSIESGFTQWEWTSIILSFLANWFEWDCCCCSTFLSKKDPKNPELCWGELVCSCLDCKIPPAGLSKQLALLTQPLFILLSNIVNDRRENQPADS